MFTVLIVDDHVPFRKLLRGMICARFPDLSIQEAGDGCEVFQCLTDILPNLVFMDINLPDINGLQLTRSIKTDHPETIVIVLTGYNLPEYREAAYQAGADFFLSKESTNEEEIFSTIKSILANQAPGPDASRN